MMRTLLLVTAVLLCGCADDQPGGLDPTNSVTEGPSQPPSSSVSLSSCERFAFLMHVDEAATQSLMAPGYELDGDGVVGVVSLLFKCPVATIGDTVTVQEASLAVTYAFLDSNSTAADTHVYSLEVLASHPELVGFFAQAGFTATLAEFDIGLGLQGGSFAITGPGLSYQGTVAGMLDEEGTIQDHSFLFTQATGGREANLLHPVAYDISSRTVAAATIQAEGGALGTMFTGPADAAASDRCIVDALFEEFTP